MNTIMNEIELEARANYGSGGRASRMVNNHHVGCHIVSAMINRGYATGDTKRATWYIDGRRSSAAAVQSLIER